MTLFEFVLPFVVVYSFCGVCLVFVYCNEQRLKEFLWGSEASREPQSWGSENRLLNKIDSATNVFSKKKNSLTNAEKVLLHNLAVERGECLLCEIQNTANPTINFIDACEFIKTTKFNNIFCVPDFNAPCAFFSGRKVLCCTSPTMYNKIDWLVDRSKMDLVEVIRGYGVGALVLSLYEEQQKIPLLESKVKTRCVYRNKEFVVYEVNA